MIEGHISGMLTGMKRLAFLATVPLIALMIGCTFGQKLSEAERPERALGDTMKQIVLTDLGPAPEIANEIWINLDQPTTLSQQAGKVVLVEFWTLGCINCQRTLPHLNDWFDRYGGDSFTVLGVHYPEFSYERDIDNVVEAVGRYDIKYPVVIDNDGLVWRAYGQRFWPTTYLVDKNGRIRYKHIGEFNEQTAGEAARTIEALIAEPAEETID